MFRVVLSSTNVSYLRHWCLEGGFPPQEQGKGWWILTDPETNTQFRVGEREKVGRTPTTMGPKPQWFLDLMKAMGRNF